MIHLDSLGGDIRYPNFPLDARLSPEALAEGESGLELSKVPFVRGINGEIAVQRLSLNRF